MGLMAKELASIIELTLHLTSLPNAEGKLEIHT